MEAQLRTSVVIPARLESVRLPRKPLLEIGGKTILQRVWERASLMQRADEVVIATDAEEIRDQAQSWGARALLTSSQCPNGTARAAELLPQLSGDFILNVQGDEPFIEPDLLDALVETWRREGGDVITPVRRIDTVEELNDPALVKAVRARDGRAVYFTRGASPFLRGVEPGQWPEQGLHWAHIGVYGFSRETLAGYVHLETGLLETAERLEQLRFLEHGLTIRTVETEYRPLGIDTPEDLAEARDFWERRHGRF